MSAPDEAPSPPPLPPSVGEDKFRFPVVEERVASFLMGIHLAPEVAHPEGETLDAFLDDAVRKVSIVLSFCGLMVAKETGPFRSLPGYSQQMLPFLLGMKLGWRMGQAPFVEVRPSPVHGNGVFSLRDVGPGAVLTSCPVDALLVRDPEEGMIVLADRPVHSLFAYFSSAPGETEWAAGGDTASHDPHRCGHVINDARGTPHRVNCAFHTVLQGTIMVVVSTEEIRAGEELFLSYGEEYWATHAAEEGGAAGDEHAHAPRPEGVLPADGAGD